MGKFVEKYGRDRLVNELIPEGMGWKSAIAFSESNWPHTILTDERWLSLKNILVNGSVGLANMSDEQLEDLCKNLLAD